MNKLQFFKAFIDVQKITIFKGDHLMHMIDKLKMNTTKKTSFLSLLGARMLFWFQWKFFANQSQKILRNTSFDWPKIPRANVISLTLKHPRQRNLVLNWSNFN